MQIPTQEALIAVAAAFRQANFHIRFCEVCELDMRLPEMCTVGQRLTLDAATALTPAETAPIEPFPPTVAEAFEQAVRDQLYAELVYYADRMEVAQPDRADVRRDAHEVRRAARVACDGLGAHFFKGALAEDPTRHMDEISRLRALLDEEITLRVVAERWADMLAYRIAPPEVIGHQSIPGATPWDDAFELVTPAAEVASLREQLAAAQSRIRDLERESATADPERMAVLRPEFIKGASVEAIQLKIKRARMNRTRWTNRVAKLEALLQERLTQVEAGTWPDTADSPGPSVRKCPDFCGCHSAQPAEKAVLPQREPQLSKTVFPIPDSDDKWSWQCPEETGGCGYRSVSALPSKQVAQGGYDDHRGQCAPAPAADPSQCSQNRKGTFVRLTDPAILGPHFYKDDDVCGLRCVYCDVLAHWGGEPLGVRTVPTYVFNASSVNRTAKHFIDPLDPRTTLCPRSLPASAPMSSDEAARLPLCGACRRTVTGEQD